MTLAPLDRSSQQQEQGVFFGWDISSEMIESAKNNLRQMGIIDKFELSSKEV
jgi:23S rRNA G2445 N2-methylase RlmL